MRSLTARILLVATLAALAFGPGVALAQDGDPFNGLPAATTNAPAVTTTTASTTVDNGGLKDWQEILIFLAGVALIAGIGFAIVGDARKVAPVTDAELDGAHQTAKSGARKAQNKAQARKKGKAQRQARKANR